MIKTHLALPGRGRAAGFSVSAFSQLPSAGKTPTAGAVGPPAACGRPAVAGGPGGGGVGSFWLPASCRRSHCDICTNVARWPTFSVSRIVRGSGPGFVEVTEVCGLARPAGLPSAPAPQQSRPGSCTQNDRTGSPPRGSRFAASPWFLPHSEHTLGPREPRALASPCEGVFLLIWI